MIDIQRAISLDASVTLHAVSGEFYEGVCTCHPDDHFLFDIHTAEQVVTLPRWAVKRIWAEEYSL
ncbi:hypothetical protein QWJ34_16730 [Saccharibacillus sp. CPCC 101409]|uniref:hypothetical protein n=1 Tax=Saccharibacillus sp. CPCC 101409 TaxID=3058041 RepID=UPI0026723654|nr:hypothetical protein [Saccharibacillus sp. CPCC 101409]MDO3411413.1 hypothetical protein [Saccharibacillus sp. CPCC 101409]